MALQKIIVSPEQLVGELGSISEIDLDALPFGAIQLDTEGVVIAYNRFESEFAQRAPESVIGRNFFTEIAPCSRVQRFQGAFLSGVERRSLNEVFDFVFRFPSGDREVRIRMIYSGEPKPAVWIFTTPMNRT